MRPGTSNADEETVDENLTQRLVRGDYTAANVEAGGRLSAGACNLCWTNHIHLTESRLCHGERPSAFLCGRKGKLLTCLN